MSEAGSSLAATLLGVLLVLAALSLLVQVVQEVWKFLASSRARCYSRVLVDFLGPWAETLLTSGVLLDLQARGPFQLRRLRPTGILLPLGRDELVDGLERTAPYWHRRTLQALRLEEAVQRGEPAAPSPAWLGLLRDLAAVEPGDAGEWTAREAVEFLAEWGEWSPRAAAEGPPHGADAGVLDARAARTAFRRRFLPHVVAAEDHFPQLMKTFEYEYRRRNLRQTFTIALLLAVLADLPLQAIWRRAATPGSGLDLLLDRATLRALWEEGAGAVGAWAAGCLLTALVICFGAPLWHDLTKLIASLASGRRGPGAATAGPPRTGGSSERSGVPDGGSEGNGGPAAPRGGGEARARG